MFLEAAKSRGEALDHVVLYGPPGLGKTTLSQIVAQELGVDIRITAGPILTKAGDLAAILTNLKPNDVLFIDEIHRLPIAVEEVLYSAMEDYALDLVIGEGPAARSVRISLPKFTLIGATTRLGLLSNPLKDRFGIPLKLDFYNPKELQQIVERGAKVLDVSISSEAAGHIAKCSRGTPRISLRLLRRVRDFSHASGEHEISVAMVLQSLKNLGVDELGLDGLDRKYINYIAKHYNGGPVGIETISAGVAEDRDTIEDTVEPFLMQIGFLNRTPKGRELSNAALMHFGFPLRAANNEG